METITDGDCPSCGAHLPTDARWCGRCGTHRPEQASRPGPDRDQDDDPGPSAQAIPIEATTGHRTGAVERLGWFVAGLLVAGLITLMTSLVDRSAEPSTAIPVPDGPGDGDVVDSDPDRREEGSPADTTSDADPDSGSTMGIDARDAGERTRRDSLATCRTVGGDACGPAYDLDGTTTSQVRIVGDHLLALDHGGRVIALSVATGTQRWQRPTGMDAPEMHLTVAEGGDRFIVWSPTRVQARDLEGGQVLWETSDTDAARTGADRTFGSVHLIDDAVVLLGHRTVTVLDAATGDTNLQVMHGDGQVRLLPDGFAIAEGDQVRRWGADDPTPRWEETFTDTGEGRFVDRPSGADTAISGAPLAVETSRDGDLVILDPSDGRPLFELSGGQHHDLRRLDDLLVSVTWPERDRAMARIVGTRRGGTTRVSEVALPCCDVEILPGPDDFVGVASPQVGYDAVLVDVDRGVRLTLVRPDEIVGQRTPTTLTATLALWRSPTGQVGADQLTGRVHWRASARATPLSTHPLILAGERSVVWVTAPSGADR